MGYCKTSPAVVARIINEGHILGNHSVSHKSFPTLTVAEMKKEIQGLHDYIKTRYGYEMFLFRPPMGEYSELSLAVAQNRGSISASKDTEISAVMIRSQPPLAFKTDCRRL